MKIKIILGVLIIAILTIASKFILDGRRHHTNSYQLEAINRGDLANTVSSTGNIKAVSTVEVGTQVSGIIDKLYVDFNAQVRKGQLLAVLDTVLLKTSLMDAQATVERVQAQVELASADYERNFPLFEKGLISEAEFLPVKINLKTQKANLSSAQAAFLRAERNLKYAFIRSPIDGKVIQRNVEAGQTVAASLQAPTLFIIAEDLSKMEIHAQVDESDIGLIKEGQRVNFDVQSYSDKTFTGTVRQIRLQPTTTQNVVNYTVVIDAANPEYLLLPGMTATVDFIVEEKKDVLLVPNTALKFQPPEKVLAAIMDQRRKQMSAGPDSARAKMFGRGEGSMGQRMPGFGPQEAKNFGRVWYLDENHHLAMARLRTGATDGKMTEVVMSRDLTEGMQVIVATAQPGQETTKKNNTSTRGFRPPPPF